MQIQELVDAVSQRAGIDTATAEKVAGTILSIIQTEGEGNKVGELFSKIPGAADLASKYPLSTAGSTPATNGAGGGVLGGLLDKVTGSLLGAGAASVLAGITSLAADGLTLDQIKSAGNAVLSSAKQAAGPDLVRQVAASVPGLDGHFSV